MKKQTKSITLRQVAKLARTSKSTVSRVLTNHPSVSPKTRARIESVIRKQGFRPNLFARGLAGGRTGLIAVIAAEINSGFYAEVIKGIDEIAGQHDGHLLSSFAHGVSDYVRLWKELAEGGRADGIILVAPPMEILSHDILPNYIPTVLCACRAQRSKKGWSQMDSVTIDNQKAMEQVLAHLVEQGCQSMVHVAGPMDVFDAIDRRKSFETFLEHNRHIKGEVIQGSLTREGGRAAVLEYLNRHAGLPDSFVAFNDSTALGVLEALKEHGVHGTKAIAVTGCDDEPASAFVGLTTLHMPMVELGRETARLLFDRLEKRSDENTPRHTVVGLTLTVRDSSRIAGRKP
jgi:LacI family transcriptional regulator